MNLCTNKGLVCFTRAFRVYSRLSVAHQVGFLARFVSHISLIGRCICP